MSYIPHGKYPEGEKFNIKQMYPKLFKDVDFEKTATTLGERFFDLVDSGIFLYSSQYQDNYGAKLVMLLSAIERISGHWKPLEATLNTKLFNKEFNSVKSVDAAWLLLKSTISQYNESFGSMKSVYTFYRDFLTEDQKQRLIRSLSAIRYQRLYSDDAVDIYTNEDNKSKTPKIEPTNDALLFIVKNLIYDIRNAFVHRADYYPFPDKKILAEKTIVNRTRKEKGIPKEEWEIRISFESLHEMTKEAFEKYWHQEIMRL